VPEGPDQAAFTVRDSVRYAVTERLVVANHGPGAPLKQNLWVALIGTVAPYQEVHAMEIAPDGFRLFADELGNRYAEFDLSGMPANSQTAIEIRYQVTVNELAYDLASCTGPVPQEWVEPELHIESNNAQIRDLAGELSQGVADGCQQLRAFYDHIGNTLTYTYNGEQWGAQAALGPMGADCTEYAALMAALSRAAGLPARYLEGVAYLTDENASLGQAQHAWLEVYLPGIGWAPMDPTFGRLPTLRDTYFAHLTPDHIIVARGASPSVLRGSSYFTHLYWPGDSATINIEDFSWTIEPIAR
jgi:transglutaminase-like putative cysteine protease